MRGGGAPKHSSASSMGAFVYQRKNGVRDGADECERRCKRHACDLQQCVAKLPVAAHTHVMDLSPCNVFLDKYKTCCEHVNAERKESGA